jgi:hypothetical protein
LGRPRPTAAADPGRRAKVEADRADVARIRAKFAEEQVERDASRQQDLAEAR